MWQVPRIPVAILTICAALWSQQPARADVVSIIANKDNTILSEDDQRSNGSGEFFFSGRTNIGNLRRGLLAFDIAAAVPPGSTIDSVSLRLYMSQTMTGSQSIALHRLLADWGEGASNADANEGSGAAAEAGDATWAYTFYNPADPPSSPAWSVSGGDFTGPASATINVGFDGYYTWGSTTAMVADVQSWLDVPATSHGWILIGNESTNQTAKRFNSRQDSDPESHPELTVTFTPPGGGPGACCLSDGTCSELSPGNCTFQEGTYQGDGSLCISTPCPQPGACCLPDGTCTEITESDCTAQLGAFQGIDMTCAETDCLGACCADSGSCSLAKLDDCTAGGGTYQGYATSCTPNDCPVVLTPYLDPLPLPAVAQPVSGTVGGMATYDIVMEEFYQQLHSDLPPTRVWGYGGSYPGPTIEAGRDLPVTVRWINDLRDDQGQLRTDHYLPVDLCPHGAENLPQTVVHLHGGHVPADVDGHPEFTFLPGGMDEYVYPNNQPPATLWYHDHGLGITRLNVYMGLAGFYLIRDDFELGLGLPSGEFEVPLVIQDRAFNGDGSWKYPTAWQDHFFGDTILVNGKVWPFMEVKQGKYRFRLLNGSNSRTYTIGLTAGFPFQQIGSDGGLLPQPVEVNNITLAGGERADIVIDFSLFAPGVELIMTNSAPAPFPGTPGVGVIPEIMKFVVQNDPGHTDSLPAKLRPVDPLQEADAVQTRDFELQKFSEPCAGSEWLINGLGWNDIVEFPVLGTTEIWRFINRSGSMHPMHMHLVFFQVLDRQDFEVIDDVITPIGAPVPPTAEEAGWKDTVKSMPNQITRVIARFEDYTGLFPYHCHILEHEDHEMMRQFQAVECIANSHCDDGEFCNGAETCVPETMACEPGTPPCAGQACNEADDTCECVSRDDCADVDLDEVRDDPCTWWACQADVCSGTEIHYADLGGPFGACPPDGTVDANDRFHALNCFSDQTTLGTPGYSCEDAPPASYNVDAAGLGTPCTPDGTCDANDAFAALNAFEGNTSCSCPLDGPLPIAPQKPRRRASAGLVLKVDLRRVRSGDLIEVEVHLDRTLPDLRGYQLHMSATGGSSGHLELVDIAVRPGKDHVFGGQHDWAAFNVHSAKMTAGFDGPGVDVGPRRYLATFTYRASRDASGPFMLEVLHSHGDPTQRSALFATPEGATVSIRAGGRDMINVWPPGRPGT